MSELVPEWRIGDLVLTDAPFAVMFDSVDYGAPENVTEVVRALLDGDVEVSSRSGNRAPSLIVFVEDSDMLALANNEALIVAECDKPRNSLYCDPGDTYGPPFIFDVFKGQLVFTRDDRYEMAGYRAYSLSFRALPFSRSVTETAIAPTGVPVGSDKQKSYSFTSPGSARAEASLHVSSPTGDFSDILAYTRPGAQGMIPLRQYRTGGSSVVTDSGAVSGAYDTSLAAGSTFSIPKADVPDGSYILVALVRADADPESTDLQGAVTTVVDGYEIHAELGVAATVELTALYQLVQLGRKFQIPAAVVGDEALVTISVEITAAPEDETRLDEAWLIEVGEGDLTWIDGRQTAGEPQPAHIWVEPATTDRPYRRVLQGLAPDKSDAFGAQRVTRWGQHVLNPGANSAFVVGVGDLVEPDLDLSVFARWHTHAGS